MTVGWGIIGLGGIAQLMARAIAQAGNASLVAVCSRDPSKAESFAASSGAQRHYASYEALLDDPRVEAIYIATPNALHAPQALAALAAGKHVLVEKPMALTVRDARDMMTAAQAAGRLLGIGFHLRHHAVHQEIKRRIIGGAAGDLVFGTALWGSYAPDLARQRERWQMQPQLAGAGSLMGIGVHEIDLLSWLLGSDVVEVTAMADGPNENYPVEFLTAATLRLRGGTIAQLVSSRRLPNGANSVSIYGTKERLDGYNTLGMSPTGELRVTRGAETIINRIPLRDAYGCEIEAFSQAAEDGGDFTAGGEEGARSVAITSAIIEAAQTGRAVQPVQIDPIDPGEEAR